MKKLVCILLILLPLKLSAQEQQRVMWTLPEDTVEMNTFYQSIFDEVVKCMHLPNTMRNDMLTWVVVDQIMIKDPNDFEWRDADGAYVWQDVKIILKQGMEFDRQVVAHEIIHFLLRPMMSHNFRAFETCTTRNK